MKNNGCFSAIAAGMILCACGPKPDTPMEKQSPIDSWRPAATYQAAPEPAVNAGRVNLTRIGIVEDDAAYNGRRAIYIIVDRKTGQEFIGVSGIGISETGSHQCGKTRCTDER